MSCQLILQMKNQLKEAQSRIASLEEERTLLINQSTQKLSDEKKLRTALLSDWSDKYQEAMDLFHNEQTARKELIQELKRHTDPVDEQDVKDEIESLLESINADDDDDFIFIPNSCRENVIISMLHGSEVKVENLTKSNSEKAQRINDLENLCVAKTTNEDFANLKMNEMAERLNVLAKDNGDLKRKVYKLKQGIASKSNEVEVSENARKTLKRKFENLQTIVLDD